MNRYFVEGATYFGESHGDKPAAAISLRLKGQVEVFGGVRRRPAGGRRRQLWGTRRGLSRRRRRRPEVQPELRDPVELARIQEPVDRVVLQAAQEPKLVLPLKQWRRKHKTAVTLNFKGETSNLKRSI